MSLCDLRDALTDLGCAMCHLKGKVVERHLDGLLWENVNKPRVRGDIRQSRGFCHEHAWGLAWDGASVGVVIIMRDVLQHMLKTLKHARFQPLPALSLRHIQESLDPKQPSTATAELVARLSPQAPCPACVQPETIEKVFRRSAPIGLPGLATGESQPRPAGGGWRPGGR